MGTFERYVVGDTIAAAVTRTLTEHDITSVVELGGYTHPLFTDPASAAASPFGARPAPGQALLLWMGGMAEQTGIFDDTTIGLVGFDAVAFRKPAFAGDALTLSIEIRGKEHDAKGRGVLVMAWLLHRADQVLVEATARMLFSV
jgi:acyl dehydratase